MRFLVLDDRGRELGDGSNLLELQQRLKRQSEAALVRATEAPPTPGNRRGRGSRKDAPGGDAAASAGPSGGSEESVAEQRELAGWPERDLPETFEIRRKNGVIRAWPTLQLRDPAHPATSKVDLVLATTSADQMREHPRAVAVLLARSVPSPATYVLAHLTSQEKLALAASPYRSTEQLLADATIALAQRAVDAAGEPVRTRAAFDAMRERFNAELIDALFDVVRLVGQVLTAHRDALRAIKGSNAMTYLATLTDVRGQLEALVFDGFVSRTGLEQLQHLPRYLRAATARIERLSMSAATERAGAAELEQALALYRDAGGTLPLALDAPEHLVAARWLLEEFRVSLFAQQLGTAQPASLKRLRKLLGG
jgi:ATP-dependent helicase HrpA